MPVGAESSSAVTWLGGGSRDSWGAASSSGSAAGHALTFPDCSHSTAQSIWREAKCFIPSFSLWPLNIINHNQTYWPRGQCNSCHADIKQVFNGPKKNNTKTATKIFDLILFSFGAHASHHKSQHKSTQQARNANTEKTNTQIRAHIRTSFTNKKK